MSPLSFLWHRFCVCFFHFQNTFYFAVPTHSQMVAEITERPRVPFTRWWSFSHFGAVPSREPRSLGTFAMGIFTQCLALRPARRARLGAGAAPPSAAVPEFRCSSPEGPWVACRCRLAQGKPPCTFACGFCVGFTCLLPWESVREDTRSNAKSADVCLAF